MDRRRWLGTSLLALGGLATGVSTQAQPSVLNPPKARLRFSSWLRKLPGDFNQQLDFVEKAGFEAIELRGNIMENRQEWVKVLGRRAIPVSGMDWAHMTYMLAEDATLRQKPIDSLKYAIDAAHELKVPVLVCVPPRLGQKLPLPDSITSRSKLMEILIPLGELAAQAGTCLGIEAVDRKSVSCFHTLAEVAGFVRESQCTGLGIVADFCPLMKEETNLTGAMLSGGQYIKQVHLASRIRTLPGEESEDAHVFLEGFRGLKMIGYQKFCSFESGKPGTYEQGVIKSMAFLRDIWDQA